MPHPSSPFQVDGTGMHRCNPQKTGKLSPQASIPFASPSLSHRHIPAPLPTELMKPAWDGTNVRLLPDTCIRGGLRSKDKSRGWRDESRGLGNLAGIEVPFPALTWRLTAACNSSPKNPIPSSVGTRHACGARIYVQARQPYG